MKEPDPISIDGLNAEQVLDLVQREVNKGAKGRDMRLLAGTLSERIPLRQVGESKPEMTDELKPGMRLWGVLVV